MCLVCLCYILGIASCYLSKLWAQRLSSMPSPSSLLISVSSRNSFQNADGDTEFTSRSNWRRWVEWRPVFTVKTCLTQMGATLGPIAFPTAHQEVSAFVNPLRRYTHDIHNILSQNHTTSYWDIHTTYEHIRTTIWFKLHGCCCTGKAMTRLY